MDTTRKRLLPPPSPSSSSETNERLAKKPRGILPPAREVCFICRCGSFETGGYNIYVVDLNSSDPFSSIRGPTLRLDDGCFDDGRCHDERTFCVLGSTLYIIEGCDYGLDDINAKDELRRSVFTVELPSSSEKVSGLRLEKSMLEEAPNMNYPKFFPLAVPTPDGKKLVVFSSIIDVVVSDEKTSDSCDFELYDPASRSWSQLPGICESLGDDWVRRFMWSNYNRHSIRINMYTFISGSVLFLQTEAGMLYLDLDLESPDNGGGWKEMDSFYGARYFPQQLSYAPYFLVIGDGLCLTPFRAYDIGSSRYFHFPQSSPALPSTDEYYPSTNHALTLLDVDNNVECNLCIIQTVRMPRNPNHPILVIDVYRCDLIKLRCDLIKLRKERKEGGGEMGGYWNMGEKWITGEDSLPPGTTVVKSLEFHLDAPEFRVGAPHHLFPIRAGAN